MVFEEKKPLKKSKQLLKILKNCQEIVDKNEYERIVSDVKRHYDTETERILQTNELKHVSKFISSLINVIFSVVAVFTAVYYASYTFSSDVSIVNIYY